MEDTAWAMKKKSNGTCLARSLRVSSLILQLLE